MVFECITVTFTWIKTVPEILRLRSHTRSTRALVYVLFRDGTSHLSTPHLTLTVCWLSSTRNIAIHVRHTSYLSQASFKQLNLKHSALLLMNIVDLLVLLPKVRFFAHRTVAFFSQIWICQPSGFVPSTLVRMSALFPSLLIIILSTHPSNPA